MQYFFKEIDQSIRKKCHKLQDVNVYLIQFQTFTQDLMMLPGQPDEVQTPSARFLKKAPLHHDSENRRRYLQQK